MTVKKESGQIGPSNSVKGPDIPSDHGQPYDNEREPNDDKENQAPSRSEFEGGCQDSAYRVNVAASKPKTNAPIARLHIKCSTV
jgi:hypothetical protein